MILKCLGSSSAGNTYILESDTECLILDTGISFNEVKKSLKFNISKIKGVLVTHCHKDHSKYADEYSKCGIPVYRPYLENEMSAADFNQKMNCGFSVTSFGLNHDDVPCYGFMVKHKELGKLLYITDTSYVRWNFLKSKVNHIMVESNYSKDYVNMESSYIKHVIRGHMEIGTTSEFLKANATPELENVVLLHLSDGGSNADEFSRKIKEIVPNANVYVADTGVEVNLNEVPF